VRIRLIVNPTAGRGNGLYLAKRLENFLVTRGVRTETVRTNQKGDALRAAAQPDVDCVVVVGGDGTVNEVANGIGQSGIPMALLPAGTANAIARELHIPKSPETLGELILRNQTRTIDAGLCGNRRFLLCGGAGPDAAVIHYVHKKRKGRLGVTGYLLPVLLVMTKYSFPSFRVTLDDYETFDGIQYAVIANCKYSAGIFPATREASVADGLLDLVMFHNLNIVRLAGYAARSFFGSLATSKDVIYRKVKTVIMEPLEEPSIHFQLDGDPAGFLPVTIEIETCAMKIIAPD